MVVAVLGLIVAAVMQTFNHVMPRVQLRGATEEISRLITQARVPAIKRGVETVISVDYASRTLTAFAELNGDPANPLTPGELYLFYDPTAGVNEDRTDFEIGYVRLPGSDDLGIQFGEPLAGVASAASVVDFTANPPDLTGPGLLVFEPNGSVRDIGAFRIIDSKLLNSLEIAVVNITGRVEVGKYLFAGDDPGGAGADYYPEGNQSFGEASVGGNVWVWY